jgi:hypothetical protein
VNVTGIDPRDERWGVDTPAYRVYFHDARGTSDEYELTGADVTEVLAWAETERRGRTYVAYVCTTGRDGLGLIRLAGADPNDR